MRSIFPFMLILSLASSPLPKKVAAMTSASSASSTPVAKAARALKLFLRTPLIRSEPLSQLAQRDVYLKLDALQASGSFKDRGMAHLCHTLKETDQVDTLISSSGGNAGLAVATVGKALGLSVQVIVPETTKQVVIDKLSSLGATVTVHGENWNAADTLARKRVEDLSLSESSSTAAYISPYDHPLLWTGHSSVVDEIMEDVDNVGAIIVSVGGGGLICGILEGLKRVDRQKGITVVAAETEGAASFGTSWLEGKIMRLGSIDSVATSLGALEVTPVALDRSRQHVDAGGVIRESICTDKEAVAACLQFSKDHRLLVEPACGAALAAIYSDRLRDRTFHGVEGSIVVEVCGGSGVSLDLLHQWQKSLGL